MQIANPVLPGFNADPSMIRVGGYLLHRQFHVRMVPRCPSARVQGHGPLEPVAESTEPHEPA